MYYANINPMVHQTRPKASEVDPWINTLSAKKTFSMRGVCWRDVSVKNFSWCISYQVMKFLTFCFGWYIFLKVCCENLKVFCVSVCQLAFCVIEKKWIWGYFEFLMLYFHNWLETILWYLWAMFKLFEMCCMGISLLVCLWSY